MPATTTLISTLYKTPRSYAFYELPGQPEEYIFKHRLIDKIIEISKPPTNLRILRATIGINPLEIPKPDVDPVTLGPGEVIIEQTREYDVGQPVTIVSGTNLKLGAKASLIVRGPLMIRGNPSDPVIVRPLDPGQPFGVLAVFGKETGGTRIRYLDMEGGSIHRRFNLKFSGMLSIHDCPDVEILNSRFGKNFLGDDAVHIARSIAIVKNTVFENALFDSMDWDKVNGEVTNSHFLNSGNDGLDLSMGDVRVTSTRFKGCGDKCISAGEGVRITITGSSFHDGKNCIAVKDRSQAKLENNLFANCRIAYHSYRKKWRWEKGGQGRIKNSRFLGSIEADVAGDKHSQIIFSNVAPKNLKVKGNIAIKNKF